MTPPSFTQAIELCASIGGLALSALLLRAPRFGPSSVLLACLVTAFSLAAGAVGAAGLVSAWPAGEAFLFAYSLAILAAPAGLLFSLAVARGDDRPALRGRVALPLVCAAAPFLVAFLHLIPASLVEGIDAGVHLPLGPTGHVSALYVLLLSVWILANLERLLRHAEEHVRWELKFLLLGLATTFAAALYLASQVLLSPLGQSSLRLQAFRVLTIVLPLAWLLIYLSWLRSTGRSKVAVSQSIVTSSVTFLGVAVYLITSSFLAQWIATLTGSAPDTRAVVFLVSAVLLAAGLLSARLRHNASRWIRRHVFSGRYDFRSLWLETTDRLRDSDTPEAAARTLADLIHGALGALGVTVWWRTREPGKLRLLAVHGQVSEALPREVSGLPAAWFSTKEPFAAADRPGSSSPGSPPAMIRGAGPCLVVPLCSGGETVGFAIVGQDRSGHAFGWEARECLGVLAAHAAAEFHRRELLAAQVEAKETEAFRSFSTFLLHDLKNFASTLSLVARNAAQHQGNPEFQNDAFRSVFETAEKMKALCNKLNTFSGSFAAHRRLADLNRVIREVSASLDSPVATRVRLELAEIPLLSIAVDEIASVVRNLLLNATEAVAAQGTVTVRTLYAGGNVEVLVEDDGPGMSREFLDQEAFVPFRTTKSTGLGIGLFQSKKIIEAHGGTIELRSEEGKGTTVRAALPVAAEAGGRREPA